MSNHLSANEMILVHAKEKLTKEIWADVRDGKYSMESVFLECIHPNLRAFFAIKDERGGLVNAPMEAMLFNAWLGDNSPETLDRPQHGLF